jgi:hypothetical protein
MVLFLAQRILIESEILAIKEKYKGETVKGLIKAGDTIYISIKIQPVMIVVLMQVITGL